MSAVNLEAERVAFEAEYGPKDSFSWLTEDGRYKSTPLQLAWEIWQKAAARRAPQAQGALPDALPVIRDLDAISMALGARLAQMESRDVKGADYLLRDAVMREVMEWRRQWDKNSAARPDFAAAIRAQQYTVSDAARLDWLEANRATLTRLYDNSGYIVAVNGRAMRTSATAREAIDAAIAAIQAQAGDARLGEKA